MRHAFRRLFPILLAAFSLIAMVLPAALQSGALMPFHISAAALCCVSFIACVCAIIAIHIKSVRKNSENAAQSSSNCPKRRIFLTGASAIALCDVGLIFAAETLITGMIWAKRAWGAAWVWEPRLSGMLLMTLTFAAWRLSCAILGGDTPDKMRYAAPLLILGLPALFFTHFAVRLFGGIHPDSVAQSGAQFPGLAATAAIILGHIGLAAAIFIFRSSDARREE